LDTKSRQVRTVSAHTFQPWPGFGVMCLFVAIVYAIGWTLLDRQDDDGGQGAQISLGLSCATGTETSASCLNAWLWVFGCLKAQYGPVIMGPAAARRRVVRELC